MKIVMIGPTYPFKGGISHHTSFMYRILNKSHKVSLISYSFQYPKLLYKKEQKDYSDKRFKIDETKYWINSANPFNWFKVALKIRKMEADMVIFTWAHFYFAPCFFLIAKMLKTEKKILICHNVLPHERLPGDKILTKLTFKQINGFIVHSKSDEYDLINMIKNPVYELVKMPRYNFFKFTNISKKDARNLLSLKKEQKILLFFGLVREYKGLKYLIQAMPLVKNRYEDIHLLIVGDFWNDKESYIKLIMDNNLINHVTIVDKYVPDNEVERYFSACDLVVLPYISATQSGVAQIAFAFEKPVIATNVGGLPEVVTDKKNGYIVSPQNHEEISAAIIKYFEQGKSEEFIKFIKEEEKIYSWEQTMYAIEQIHRRLNVNF